MVAYLASHDSGAPLSTYVGAPTIAGRFFYREDMNGFNFDRGTAPFRAVADMLLGDLATGAGPAIYSGAASAVEHFPTFAADNPMPLLDPTAIPRLWIGNAVTVSTHYDTADNIACVAAGHRHFTLFPPHRSPTCMSGPWKTRFPVNPSAWSTRWRLT
nr:cupin-like domain-containing protein [Sphingomonas sp. H160509]